MKYDKPLIAGVLGAISTIAGQVITRGLVSTGIGKYSVYQLISLIVTINRPHEFIGLINNFIIGGFFGVVFYYSLILLGRDYLFLKAICASLFFWILSEIIFTSAIEGRYIDVRPFSDYYVHLIGATSYGATMGWLFKRYLFARDKHEEERQSNEKSYHSSEMLASPACKHCPDENENRFEKILNRHDKLLIRAIRDGKETKKCSFLSRSKFW